jgi:hypothetical protein
MWKVGNNGWFSWLCPVRTVKWHTPPPPLNCPPSHGLWCTESHMTYLAASHVLRSCVFVIIKNVQPNKKTKHPWKIILLMFFFRGICLQVCSLPLYADQWWAKLQLLRYKVT